MQLSTAQYTTSSYEPSASQVAFTIFSLTAVAFVWPSASPSVTLHTEQVLGVVQFASVHLWPSASPSVTLHTEHVLGVVQFASVHVCPSASPSVTLHTEQVLGVVQVASSQS